MTEIEPSELKRIPLFESLTWRHLTAIADLFKREEHPAGYVLCQQGKDPDNRAYFVRSGILSVRRVDEEGIMWETTRLRPGDFFGQISLLLDEPQEDTIVVIEDAVLLALTRDSLYSLADSRSALLEALQPGMPKVRADELERIPLFARLSRKERRIIAEMFKPHEYQTGREICLQGQPGREAYFVKSGELRVTRVDAQGIVQPDIDRFGPGSFFGQTSLLVGEPRDATVEVVRTAVVLSLEQGEFDKLLEEYPSILRKLQMRPEVAKRRRAPHFPWQYPDETVMVYLRKHSATLQQQLALPGLFFLIGLAGFLYGIVAGAIWALLFGVVLILPALAFAGYKTMDYRNDYYVVTNKRVINQERTPFGRESSSEASLLDIQDIQLTKTGRLAWLLNFGDLIIDTAARRQLVIFRQIPNPDGTKDVIFEQRERALAWARAEERAAIRDVMQTRFGLQSPPVRVAEPPAPPKARGFQPFAWLHTLRVLPPLRYVEGDTITWRKHWIALLRPILPPTGLIAGATVAAIILTYVSARTNLSLAPILIGYGVFLVFPVLWWIWHFSDWQNDTYHVTATRIIDIEKRPFFGREVRREANLQDVQNIAVTVPGPLARLLRYGTVVIETAGEEPFTFDLVKNPNEVRAEISRRVDARRRQILHETAQQHRDELLEWFSVYDQIHETKAHKPEPSPQEEEESQAHAST